MTIEMPKGLPFSVDTWTPSSNRKRHHFLTHAHKDHSQGITTYASYPIYCTVLTKSIVLLHYPQLDESLFVGIEVGQTLIIDDPDGDFTVTAFDANHCPGAVMFLFEGSFGNILHTGDCRLTSECLLNLPEKYIGRKGKAPRCQLDYIFLDCTFGRFPLAMPSRQSAIQQVINCIWKHPNASSVYLTCDLLGHEEVLTNVCKAFGCKIYVDKEKHLECYKTLALIVPEVLSSDPCSRFQLFDGFPGLYDRAQAKIFKARSEFHQEPLILRPSAQWYACDEGPSETEKRMKKRFDEAVRDLFGVWHVCYTIHSSREELEWALLLLAPKWVVSTTPSCRAMELDYVKKHCFTSKRTSDDHLWKLLDISMEVFSGPDILFKESSCCTVEETESGNHFQPQIQPIIKPSSPGKLLNLSPASKRPCLTLFGRARLGHHEFGFEKDEEEMVHGDIDSTFQDANKPEVCSVQTKEVVEPEFRPFDDKKGIEVTETKCEAVEIEIKKPPCDFVVRSSKNSNENLRKLYRSMNVPVPRPLPSLVELMNAHKCAKRRF